MAVTCQNEQVYGCNNLNTSGLKSTSSDSSIEHNIDHTISLNLGFKSIDILKTTRDFSLTTNFSSERNNYYAFVTEGCASPPCYDFCYEDRLSNSGTVTDVCIMEKVTPYYLDMSTHTFFYKKESESITIRTSSSETTTFKQKWGNSTHLKIRIKDVKIKGKEEFYLIHKGEERLIKTLDYLKEPTWEMGPISPSSTSTVYVPPSDDICAAFRANGTQQIIVWPLPPSKSIPMDNEIKCLGFYDYGSADPATENPLIKKDGYKDFFYCSWIRNMLADPYYEKLRDERYDIMWMNNPPRGSYTLGMPEIPYDSVPKGNAFYHHKIGSMYSFVGVDRNGESFVISDLNGVSPRDNILKQGVTGYGSSWAYHPISVI